MSNKVTVLHGHSFDVTLPQQVDLVVHEILGEVAGIEGVARVIRDAQHRLLSAFPSPLRTSIPASATSWVAACEFPDAEYWASLTHPVILPPGATTLKVWNFPNRNILSGWLEMERLDFESEGGLAEVDRRELAVAVTREGTLAGLVVRMEASLMEDGAREISSWCLSEREGGAQTCQGHWAQQMIVFGEGIGVRSGEVVLVSVVCDTRTMQPSYAFNVSIDRGGGEVERVGLRVLDSPNFG